MTLPISSVQRIIDALLGWYDANARALPWRTSGEPYHIWISEVMLQQTQVATVIPYYERFLEAFPTVEALAAADQDQVNKRWEGLGYYSRAAHLKAAAEALVADHGGELPDTAGDLIRLPGIGPYTAGAIASIAFGERTPAVDGNVMRILSRFTADETPVNTGKSRAHYTPVAANLLPAHRPGDFNQALMDLGAMICTPKAPNCPACPWQAYCAANKEALQGDLPKREKRPRVKLKPTQSLFCGIITRCMCDADRLKAFWPVFGNFPTCRSTCQQEKLRPSCRKKAFVPRPLGIWAAPNTFSPTWNGGCRPIWSPVRLPH